ncbi:amidohydrolase family protein [Kordia sp. YSTF-M3]|uniref:Amidohydrolase family protein n=1 Tax=Kordia aestuariivivens TaxID=2759037 RepID=A0ABR7Q597_9FLAO|nr:amidohydrolase family protein [Kordia aestuariivivens]MBC8753546.1 amidohydrolase family protein [Kordia aestuariivivens]
MKKILLLIVVLITQNVYAQKEVDADYAFTNVSVITMTENKVLRNKNVLVKDGKIIAITDANSSALKAKNTINLKGKYIIPSLSDAHVHLPKDESELRKFFILNLINGVTKVRSMRGNWNHVTWRKTYNTETSFYPKLYISSPPISWKYNFDDTQLAEYMNSAKKFDFIKILSIKDEATFRKLNAACVSQNISLAGHFPKNVSDNFLFESNYTSFEHLGGLIGRPSLLNDRLQKIKEKNIFICPTLSWYSVGSGRYSYEELRNQAGMKFIPTTTIDSWIEKTTVYREKIGNEAYKEEVKKELKTLDEKYKVIKQMHELGIKMLLSPDSSSKYMVNGFGVVGEMKLLKNAGLNNYQILEMTTRNFADFFNGNYGTIQKGKDADFLILNDNPLEKLETLHAIEALFFNNNYLDRETINKLSKEILPK